MIDKALEILTEQLNEYLTLLPDLNGPGQSKAELAEIINNDGTISIGSNSLGLSLVNIEEERVLKSQNAFESMPNDQIQRFNPEIKLNLYIMIAANFGQYKTALKYLSAAIRFFQARQVFNHQNTPKLDKNIQKLIVDLYTLNFEQQHHLWGLLGAKYLPSVVYRVRLVVVQEKLAEDIQVPITKRKLDTILM